MAEKHLDKQQLKETANYAGPICVENKSGKTVTVGRAAVTTCQNCKAAVPLSRFQSSARCPLCRVIVRRT